MLSASVEITYSPVNQFQFRLFAKRLNSSTFEEETLADALRMIDRLDRGNPR